MGGEQLQPGRGMSGRVKSGQRCAPSCSSSSSSSWSWSRLLGRPQGLRSYRTLQGSPPAQLQGTEHPTERSGLAHPSPVGRPGAALLLGKAMLQPGRRAGAGALCAAGTLRCRHAVPAAAQRGSPASSTSRSQISTPGSKVPTAAKLARSACTPGRKGVGQRACSVSAGRAPHAQGRCVGHCAPHDERGRGACRPCLPDPPGCSPATPRRAGRWAAAAHDAQTGCRRRVRQAPRTPTPAAGGGAAGSVKQ